MPRTLFDKVWDAHVVDRLEDGTCVLYIDRHLVHEVTSPQAFEGLRIAGRSVRRPDATIAVVDHNVPTSDRRAGIAETESRIQVETLEHNVAEFGVPYIPLLDARQGIVHIIGPELGISLPGTTIVCGDSHTSTHGALGALAFGIGTSEVEHVLATQTLLQKPAKNMLVSVEGELKPGITAKDVVLAIIGKIGTAGGNGHVIEYAGSAIRGLDMAGRMTICNMSIEAGARAGMIAPDETTFEYVRTRPQAPKGDALDQAIAYWRTLPSDEGAVYDRVVTLDAAEIQPMVSWGTNPEAVLPITAAVPDPASYADPAQADQVRRMLDYMGLQPGQKLAELPIDVVFIGSCTNGRIEDMRAAAGIVRDRHVAPGVRAMVVPGSGLVKQQAEQEGLDQVFLDRRVRMARSRLLHVPGHEPGQADGRAALCQHVQPQFRRPPGAGRPHPSALPRHGRRRRRGGTAGRCSGVRVMQAFTTLTGVAAPLPLANVDTDKIIPARFLKTIKRTGLGVHLFDTLRYDGEGAERPDFVLNQPAYRHSEILIAHENFGCGSSREHAPWALAGFRHTLRDRAGFRRHLLTATASRTASCRSACRARCATC